MSQCRSDSLSDSTAADDFYRRSVLDVPAVSVFMSNV